MQLQNARLARLRVDGRRDLRQGHGAVRMLEAVGADVAGEISILIAADAQRQRRVKISQRLPDLRMRAVDAAHGHDSIDLRRRAAEHDADLDGAGLRVAAQFRIGIVHGVGADGILLRDIAHGLRQVGGEIAAVARDADLALLCPVADK